jgi:hypothetical protein
MSLLYRGDWFYPLTAPGSLSEAEFERLVLQQAPYLFPNYLMVKYRVDVTSDDYVRRPDFALVHREYRSWWVVEVELIHHSLNHHVLQQVACFSAGSYGPEVASHLARASSHVDINLLREMLKGAPPGVLVIANAYSEEWERTIAPYGALLCVLHVYRSERNRHIFRYRRVEIDGAPEVLSVCRRDRTMPRLLIVDSPAALAAFSESPLAIYYNGAPSHWATVAASDRVWLNPVKQSPLPDSIRLVEVVRESDGRLAFRVPRKGGST